MHILRRTSTPPSGIYRHSLPLTIRWATPTDAEALQVLAELDEAPVPPAPLMLGFVDDELWAAVSPATGAALCDPFRRSAEVARLVALRGHQLTVPARRRGLGLAAWRHEGSHPRLEARLGQTG